MCDSVDFWLEVVSLLCPLLCLFTSWKHLWLFLKALFFTTICATLSLSLIQLPITCSWIILWCQLSFLTSLSTCCPTTSLLMSSCSVSWLHPCLLLPSEHRRGTCLHCCLSKQLYLSGQPPGRPPHFSCLRFSAHQLHPVHWFLPSHSPCCAWIFLFLFFF